MTDAAQIEVTRGDQDAAEEAVSAANLTTCDGYYELDIDAVAHHFARHRITAAAQAREDALRDAADVVDIHMDAVGESDYGFRVCAAILALATKATPDD